MRHRSIVLDSNDADLLRLRLAYAKEAAETIEEVSNGWSATSYLTKQYYPTQKTPPSHLHTSTPPGDRIISGSDISTRGMSNGSENSNSRTRMSKLEGMKDRDIVEMLAETTVLDEQASLVHFLWMKL